MKTWAEIVVDAKNKNACREAVVWAEERERTLGELKEAHPDWLRWCLQNAVIDIKDIPGAILTGTHTVRAGEILQYIGGDAVINVESGGEARDFRDSSVCNLSGEGEAWDFRDSSVSNLIGVGAARDFGGSSVKKKPYCHGS